MRSNAYTFTFVGAVCVGCSLLVSLAAIGLRDRIALNVEVDIQRNILRSVGLPEPGAERPLPAEIQRLFKERIVGIVVDASGNVVAGKTPADLDPETDTDLLPVFLRKDGSQVTAYSIPISGKGLWSTLYGYFALDPDGVTVRGITYYQHGETPGLGGEVEKPKFTDPFRGKKIVDESGQLRSITVAKGTAANTVSAAELPYYVDGISGATLTGNGVTAMLKATLQRYEPFFSRVRQGSVQGL